MERSDLGFQRSRAVGRWSGLAAVVAVLVLVGTVGCTGSASDEPDSSTSRLDSLRRRADSTAVEYLIAAQDAYRRGAYPQALALTDSARAIEPNLPDIYALRGNILTELRRFEDARSSYRSVLERAPDYEGMWMNLGNLALRQGNFREAISLYRKGIDRNPTAQAYTYLGRAYEELGKVDSARWAYERSIRRDSSFAEAYMRIGQLLDEEGQLETAIRFSKKGLARDSANLDYRYIVGSQIYRAGRIEEAIPYLRAVAHRRPQHHGAHYNLGQALLRIGREQEAEKYLARADSLEQVDSKIENMRSVAQSNPRNFGAWIKLAHALREAGRFEEALRTYEVARSLRPDNRVVLGNIADMHQRLGHTERALTGYRRILRRDSSAVSAWFNMGVLYANAGRTAEARHAWQQVLRYDPDHDRARAYLARLKEEAPS